MTEEQEELERLRRANAHADVVAQNMLRGMLSPPMSKYETYCYLMDKHPKLTNKCIMHICKISTTTLRKYKKLRDGDG